jgi:hypothetical protein
VAGCRGASAALERHYDRILSEGHTMLELSAVNPQPSA